MKLGMLHLFENPIDKSENQIIKEQMELMIKSEELGFDSVWPAEHHFSEYGIMGAPQVPLAAIAVKTSKIRLGTGVVVLPFHNPIRVAEDFAFLDHLSDGRVIFGVGRGYQPSEYKGFGVDQENSRDIFDEGMQLIKKVWTEENVTFKGKYYQTENLTVRPRPFQKPHPPIYMACVQPETFAIAGRNGYHVLTSAAFGLSIKKAKGCVASYRKAREEAGFDPDTGNIACLVMVYPAKTMEQARKDFRDPVVWYYRTISKYVAPASGAVKSYEEYAKTRDLAANLQFEDIVDGPIMACGDVDHCIEKLTVLAEGIGFNELLCWTRIGCLESKKVLTAMELISGEVLPALHKVSPGAA